tara:strand:- start:35 stop:385 length:351 start_codon:yes stop_codon:yes gene_type:complete
MPTNAQKLIQDLIFFYVKENYNKYIIDNNLTSIHDDKLSSVIDSLYTEKKSHIKGFLKNSLKEIMKGEYVGDLVVDNICFDIFNDDEICKNRLIMEIRIYQQKKNNENIDYSKVLK